VAAFCLGIHARYQCQHAGACCQNWTVPAESHVVAVVNARHLRRSGFTGTLFLPIAGREPHEAWTVARDERDDCVFFEREAGRLCVIHRDAGVEALPLACRHFPRKVLHDSRGTFISLSHFCPTAARMLLVPGSLAIVEAMPPLRLSPPVEGLDASGALPPLLRPGLLCDPAGYQAWEHAGIATFARDDLTSRECLDLIAGATEAVRLWEPGRESLTERVGTAFEGARPVKDSEPDAHERAMKTVAALSVGRTADSSPIDRFEESWDRHVGAHFAAFERPMRNYLATRLFANWVAYQGRGLRSVVEWLKVCAAVLRHGLLTRALGSGSPPGPEDFVEALRAADLLLLHVIDTAAFATYVAALEGPEPR
jgi:Fe-S-cluster containining protein